MAALEVHMDKLIGMGLYTPAEAGRLLRIKPSRLIRWLRGSAAPGQVVAPLWTPQVDLADGPVCLGFRDLMEARIAARFIELGISPQRVRRAILLAREVLGDEHPLSTNRFITDGRSIFLRIEQEAARRTEPDLILNLFQNQFEFAQIIEPLLKNIEFDRDGAPLQWWPSGPHEKILVDPTRAFGQPIDSETSVPTAILAASARIEGIAGAARAYDVPQGSVRRAVAFEAALGLPAAA
jgi:hypothetical protein